MFLFSNCSVLFEKKRINCLLRLCFLYEVLLAVFVNGSNENEPTTLTVCFIWEDDSYFSSYQRVIAAVDLAVQHANAFVLDKPLSLRLAHQSSGLSCTRTQYSLVSNVFNLLTAAGTKCHLFLGAGCPFTASALHGFAQMLNIPLMACPAAGAWVLQLDSTIDDFDLLVQPAYGYADLTNFITGFLEMNNYAHTTIFRDDSYSYYSVLSEAFLRFIRDRNPGLYMNSAVTAVRSKRTTRAIYRDLLKSSNERSRVIIIFGHATCVRDIMLTAYDMGMTQGQHIFLTVELFYLEYWGTIDPTIGEESDFAAVQAYKSLIVVSFLEIKGLHQTEFDDAVKILAKTKYNYTFNPLEKMDVILTSHYEGVMIYAEVVNELRKTGVNFTDGDLVIQKLTNASFNSPLTGAEQIYIGKDRQREKDYCMKIYNEKTDEMQVFVQHMPHAAGNMTFHQIRKIRWPSEDGNLPPDEPRCGFRDDKCKYEGLSPATLGVAAAVPIIVLLALIAGGVFLYIRIWKFRAEYNPNWWKISLEDLDVKNNRASSGSKRTLRSKSTGGATSGFSSYVVELFAGYRGTLVGLIDVDEMKKQPSKELADEINMLKPIEHTNLQKVIGIALDQNNICVYIVGELCSKGCLADVLENELIKLDWFFKNSLVRDIVYGMAYLHSTNVASHGDLTSFCCLIDTRFTLKISEYGLPFFRSRDSFNAPKPGDTGRDYSMLLWRAPELLRQTTPPKGTQKGDVYSFAIILQQIILRSGPFELPDDPLELSDKEIVQEVIAANIPPVRPRVPRSACSNELYDLMERCWEEVPVERPTFAKIKERLGKVIGKIGDNLVDLLLRRMEQYAGDLEQKVAEQTQQFMEEKTRSEHLLSQLLPKSVAAALTKGLSVEPEAFDCVTIFFSDIVGFTTIAGKETPMNVVNLLNSLYTFFDGVLEKYDVYKVETIGDSYMVSSGLPIRNGNRHVVEISCMAIDLVEGIKKFVIPHQPTEHIQIRSGINSGPCVAGIVGTKMPRYCLFGDTVNVASRMESSGESMKIQISTETRHLLLGIGNFLMAERGEVPIKGKGLMTTYWLLGKSNY